MLRTPKGHLECLIGVLVCFVALQSAHLRTAGSWMKDEGIPTLDEKEHAMWKQSIDASASSLPSASMAVQQPSPVPSPSQRPEMFSMPAPAPAPSNFSTVVASEPAVMGTNIQSSNGSLTPISSLPLPVLPGVSLPSPSMLVPSPPPVKKPIDVAQPTQPPLFPPSTSIPSTSLMPPLGILTPPSPPSRAALLSSTPDFSSPAPTPLPSPPSEIPSNISADAPLLPPSTGCCGGQMVPRPGPPSYSCVCVYPIRLELLVEDVSSTLTNWSGILQQDLASQLGVNTVQIEITSFQFNSSNLSLSIVIGPLTEVSFSDQEAKAIKNKLDHSKVHFNSSLFGNYTLLYFQYYEPFSPSPAQTPSVGIPPLPLGQVLPQNSASDGRSGDRPILWHYIVLAAAAVTIFFVALILLWWKCRQHCRAGKTSSMKGREIASQFDVRSFADASIPRSSTTRLFTYDELRQATSNFNPDNVLGEGGFGRVYKGLLNDGTAVAIKRFGGGGQGDREFVVEVEMLSRLHHRNLVKLVGYYTSRDSSQHLLCYELIPNGSLEAWLHGPLGANQPLDWDTRMQIALDAARGLAYLHEDSQPCVIHRDFKASNILIENNFHAKVADFGLAKQAPEGQVNYVATQVMGTFGYVAPEYAMTGHLLVKSDVYSYGVVLLELLSGRKPVDMSQPSGQENLVTWARPILRDRERLGELADPKLSNKYPKEDFTQAAAIAAACVAPEAAQRPTMGEVVQSLRLLQKQSEYTTSGERTVSMDDIFPSVAPSRSFVASIQNAHQHTLAAFESDGSSSIFSSGPFSGLALDNETFSRSAVFSEDLHEGR
eukprot:c19333_g1_i1 orf=868-3342(+)